MNAISSSIVVLSGALMLTGGGFITHAQTSTTISLIGAVVGAAGLWFWGRGVTGGEK